MTWRWLQLLGSTRERLGQRHGALLRWVGNTATHVPMSVICHWLTRSTAEAPVLQANERSGTDIFGNSCHQQFSTCYPLRRVCGPGRPLAQKDGPRDHFCWPAGALSSTVFLTMPIEGKRARTCLTCAIGLCVVCPQLIDCARARLDQALHGLRVASITRAMETLVAGPINKTFPF